MNRFVEVFVATILLLLFSPVLLLFLVLVRIYMVRNQWYRSEIEKIMNLMGSERNGLILDRCFLIKNFCKLRRRSRDAFVLLLMLVFRLF